MRIGGKQQQPVDDDGDAAGNRQQHDPPGEMAPVEEAEHGRDRHQRHRAENATPEDDAGHRLT
ncbi:hypothetical protein D9M72_576420 [compost metagenome]